MVESHLSNKLSGKIINFHSHPFIHIFHAANLGYVHAYRSYPCNDSYLGETWILEMEENIEILLKALQLPQHKFWSQIIFDDNIKCFIQDYIKYTPRAYDKLLAEYDVNIMNIEKQLYQNVFYIYLRLSTHKNHLDENNNDFTIKYFAQTVYENKIFPPEVIFDLCILYGASNSAILKKMINNITQIQIKFKQDLKNFAVYYIQDLEDNCMALLNLADNLTNTEPRDKVLAQTQLSHHLLIAFDKLYGLMAVARIHTNLYDLLYEQGLFKRLPWIYDKVLLVTNENLRKAPLVASDFKIHSVDVEKFVKVVAGLVRSLYRDTLVNRVLSLQHKTKKVQTPACCAQERQIYVDNIMEILEFKGCFFHRRVIPDAYASKREVMQPLDYAFTKSYNRKYPIVEDLDSFPQDNKSSDDDIRMAFLNSTLMSMSPTKKSLDTLSPSTTTEIGISELSLRDQPGSSSSYEPISLSNSQPEGGIDPRIAINVPKIRDFFPDMSVSLVAQCLAYYQNNPDTVINAILEENLPPHLCQQPEQVDQSCSSIKAPIKPAELPKLFKKSQVLDGNLITKRFLADRPDDWFSDDEGSDSETSNPLPKASNPKKALLNDYEDEFDDTTYADYVRSPINRTTAVAGGGPNDNANVAYNLPHKWRPSDDLDQMDEDDQSLSTKEKIQIPNGLSDSKPYTCLNSGFGRGKINNIGLLDEKRDNKMASFGKGRSAGDVGEKKSGEGAGKGPEKLQQNRRYDNKEKNKSHIGNHDRKSRAGQKMSKGMF